MKLKWDRSLQALVLIAVLVIAIYSLYLAQNATDRANIQAHQLCVNQKQSRAHQREVVEVIKKIDVETGTDTESQRVLDEALALYSKTPLC